MANLWEPVMTHNFDSTLFPNLIFILMFLTLFLILCLTTILLVLVFIALCSILLLSVARLGLMLLDLTTLYCSSWSLMTIFCACTCFCYFSFCLSILNALFCSLLLFVAFSESYQKQKQANIFRFLMGFSISHSWCSVCFQFSSKTKNKQHLTKVVQLETRFRWKGHESFSH